jgi:ATP-dependent Clp protease protease subunit
MHPWRRSLRSPSSLSSPTAPIFAEENGGLGLKEDSRNQYDKAHENISPPPDLPSILLNNRIVYIGMPLVPSVTELVIAQLLWLNAESPFKPIYMYINSPGTMDERGRPAGFETEAFAIADTMKYVRPPIHTIALGTASGAAAMLLAMGAKGHRAALPNASIVMTQPCGMTGRGQASDIKIRAKEVMLNRQTTCELLAEACGKDPATVLRDAERVRYFTPQEALDYGLIDEILDGEKGLPVSPGALMP